MTQPPDPIGPVSATPAPASSPPRQPGGTGGTGTGGTGGPDRRGWRTRATAVSLTAIVLVGTGVGVGVAAASSDATAPVASVPTGPAVGPTIGPGPAPGGKGRKDGKQGKGAGGKVDPAKVAWARRYGMDRATMPVLAPVSAASAAQRAAATDLLVRTKAATMQYNDLATAKAAGYDLQAKLASKQRQNPGIARRIEQVDSGTAAQQGTPAKMLMLHVANTSFTNDGKLLDPNAPETLMYGYQGNGKWTVMGVMYKANEAYPRVPAVPGGSITRWHYHQDKGNLMMHVFFAPANDLARAYATQMD